MKKAAVLTITAFYLLLTTGMFVCMVHCAAENLLIPSTPQMAMAMKDNHDCCAKKDHNCAQKHGSYILKENLKSSVDVQFSQTAVIIPSFVIADITRPVKAAQNTSWILNNSPPGKSGRDIAILNQTFLI
ncbi:MAG TPA: hypothetical protein VIM55_01215 [Mucilaginibacter sp.]